MPDARPDPNWTPPGTQPKNRFVEKLGVYLLGVAIGLLFLGWVQWQKSQSAKRQQPASEVEQQPSADAGTPPAAPEPGTP